jgi:hypothetical protein
MRFSIQESLVIPTGFVSSGSPRLRPTAITRVKELVLWPVIGLFNPLPLRPRFLSLITIVVTTGRRIIASIRAVIFCDKSERDSRIAFNGGLF